MKVAWLTQNCHQAGHSQDMVEFVFSFRKYSCIYTMGGCVDIFSKCVHNNTAKKVGDPHAIRSLGEIEMARDHTSRAHFCCNPDFDLSFIISPQLGLLRNCLEI